MKPKPKLDPVLVKAEEDSEEEDMDQKKGKDEPEDEAEEEAAKEEKAEKSEDLTEDDLEKSIEKLAALASVADAPTRKETLLKKGLAEDLSKAETAELFDLMGDKQAPEASLSDEITKSMAGNETIAKALDVSEYLSENHAEMVKALAGLADNMEKSDSRQHEFNMILAKAVAEEGNLLKSLCSRITEIETSPARAPKSKGIQPLSKSFAGSEPADGQLSKAEITDGLNNLFRKSVDAGDSGVLNGVDLTTASAKFEMTGHIDPRVLAQIKADKEAR